MGNQNKSDKSLDIYIIAGPTASGKSSLALRLASDIGGVIINADSMQVYKELSILTARPTEEDEALVPHKLYGTMSVAEKNSAVKWREMALAEINNARKLNKTPILVGGTGLYFKTLLEGLAQIPPISPQASVEAKALLEELGVENMYKKLVKIDPKIASKISQNDSQRISRATEVFISTGIPLSEWHESAKLLPPLGGNVKKILFDPPREVLYRACDQRFELMLEKGALEEVDKLIRLPLDPSHPILKAVGVRELALFLKGEIELDLAKKRSQQATRRYAKRQSTWFRNQFGKSKRLSAQYSESLYRKIFS